MFDIKKNDGGADSDEENDKYLGDIVICPAYVMREAEFDREDAQVR